MHRRALIVVGAVVGLVAAFVVAVFLIDAAREDRIAEGVRIAGVDVGGMTADEAEKRVQSALADDVRRSVKLRFRGERFTLRTESSKVRLDAERTVQAALAKSGDETNAFGRVLGDPEVDATVEPQVAYSEDGVQAFVERVAKRVDEPARDADIDIRDGKLRRQRARNGVTVRREQLAAALVERLGSTSANGAVEVPVRITERPDRTLADLAKRYPRVIGVDRDAKQLRFYRNLKLAKRYDIAVGQAGYGTDPGRYKIREKIVNPPWHAPNEEWAGELAGQTIPAGDPRNPLEARWLGFNAGEGIHGTADIGSLGTAASHGCIRMSVPDVKELYDEVKLGTPVFVQ